VLAEELPDVGCVVADPVSRPLASLYWVLAVPPESVRVVEVLMIRPDASRTVACTVPPDCFWRSMVWTIRPEESRTTSRQVSAVSVVAEMMDIRAERKIDFMQPKTECGRDLFRGDEFSHPKLPP
jgi:hypothetical protein